MQSVCKRYRLRLKLDPNAHDKSKNRMSVQWSLETMSQAVLSRHGCFGLVLYIAKSLVLDVAAIRTALQTDMSKSTPKAKKNLSSRQRMLSPLCLSLFSLRTVRAQLEHRLVGPPPRLLWVEAGAVAYLPCMSHARTSHTSATTSQDPYKPFPRDDHNQSSHQFVVSDPRWEWKCMQN